MKRPTPASLKKVNAENLAKLGVARLAEILLVVAETRPEVKRRLRMELAAEQGAEHLWPEIDKRLGALETSRSKVSWRQRPTFVRDLDALRTLISERLAALDPPAALSRLWLFMGLSRRVGARVRDRDGTLAEVFARAARDIAGLIGGLDADQAAEALVEALVAQPHPWAQWLPIVLDGADPAVAPAALRRISQRGGATPAWIPLIRGLADAAGDLDAYRATYPAAALRIPANAAEVARRLLAAGRTDDAGQALEAARSRQTATAPDFAWESVWIDYLDQAGRPDEAQSARWAAFERTLSVERARAFVGRLTDFEDVEAETRAFAVVARHPDTRSGLTFLMDWPALAEAGRLIQARPDDLDVTDHEAELWAAKLRGRNPTAAGLLLRTAAAAALRRRDKKTAARLTAEADSIG